MKKINISILVGIFIVLFVASNAFAGWYSAQLFKVLPQSNGDVVIQINPGVDEVGFTEAPSRIKIDRDDVGGNRILATILTAGSLNKEVRVNVPNPPTFDEVQLITAAGVTF